MKKQLTLAVVLVILAAFTGLSAAQERRKPGGGLPPPPAAIPLPNKVTLSTTQNVVSKTGCPVTAWVGFNQYPTANYTVNFVKVSGSGSAPPSGVSDTKGEVKGTVPWNTTIKATVQSGSSLLTSNNFVCGESPTSAK